MAFRVAFYKATRPGLAGIYNIAVRWWTRSKYSHVELIFSDGLSASASFLDGGVRFKKIEFDKSRWDFITLPPEMEDAARAWFKAHEGQKYDVWGNAHFVIGPIGHDPRKWFCSEAVARALGFRRAWRLNPGDFQAVLLFFNTDWKRHCNICGVMAGKS